MNYFGGKTRGFAKKMGAALGSSWAALGSSWGGRGGNLALFLPMEGTVQEESPSSTSKR